MVRTQETQIAVIHTTRLARSTRDAGRSRRRIGATAAWKLGNRLTGRSSAYTRASVAAAAPVWPARGGSRDRDRPEQVDGRAGKEGDELCQRGSPESLPLGPEDDQRRRIPAHVGPHGRRHERNRGVERGRERLWFPRLGGCWRSMIILSFEPPPTAKPERIPSFPPRPHEVA